MIEQVYTFSFYDNNEWWCQTTTCGGLKNKTAKSSRREDELKAEKNKLV